MGVGFKDISDTPRSGAEIAEAIRVVEARIVAFTGASEDPELFMQFTVIREGLRELLGFRKLLRRLGAARMKK